ncbi:hypothetical protein SDC9_211314 [bioreactor metagenome]|uniref:Uncharacterized protein n=1 Tax=bioreactor metagenome TaxID=1076179 RepID=A0A645JKA8_9ZZZZ
MLKGAAHLIHAVNVHAAFVGKSAGPDIGLVARQGHVGNIGHPRGGLLQTLHIALHAL